MCRRLYGEPQEDAHHQLYGPRLSGLGADRKSVWNEYATISPRQPVCKLPQYGRAKANRTAHRPPQACQHEGPANGA